jgi:hypothetical protein
MDSQKRLSLLQNMLNRLTGVESTEVQAPITAEPAQQPSPPADPNQRKLQLLQSMLAKLQGS